ncbi:hypothetical protein KP509_03G097600 [Ceratopteris richardii]|uniref:C2 domain-containing protein n=1 Tax=Ceratopteris richardii TaxID=49495 RepID=A0A8T2V2I6_CERRI|nr:hypothetical protein KP509_03G097600 [Ceratopteris richardii]
MRVRKVIRRLVHDWPLFPHLLLAFSLFWFCTFFSLVNPFVAIAGALFYIYTVDEQQQKWLRVRLERIWREEGPSQSHQSNHGESVQAWLNVLLRACWPAWEAGPLCRTLEARLVELLEPKKCTLERVNLGSSPPVVRSCTMWLPHSDQQHHDPLVKYDAFLDIELSYIAGDDMGIVVTVPMGYFGAKLFCDNLKFDCKLRLGMKFVAYFPYVSYLSVAFLTVPTLNLSVRPLASNGLAVTDFPIIASWVSNSLHTIIQTCGLVHPEKWEFDFLQRLGTDYGLGPIANAAAGHYAILEIIEGKNLMPKDFSGFSDPYVIVTHGNKKFKTQIRKQTLNPKWHECFHLELNSESSWNEKVLLRCRDRDLIIDDELGFYELDLKQYQNGKRCEVLCKLQDADCGELVVAITVIANVLHSYRTAGEKKLEPVAQHPSAERNETFASHAALPSYSNETGKSSEAKSRTIVHCVSTSTEAEHFFGSDDLVSNNAAEISVLPTTACPIMNKQDEDPSISTSLMQASSSTSVVSQRALSGPFISSSSPRTKQIERAATMNITASSAVMSTASSSTTKDNGTISYSSKGFVTTGKMRRSTSNAAFQSRRSALYLNRSNSSVSGRNPRSNVDSQSSSRKSRVSLPPSSSWETGSVPSASNTKFWRPNFFKVAFPKKKQKRSIQS